MFGIVSVSVPAERHLDLFLRFFIRERDGVNKVEASEIRLDYSSGFQSFIREREAGLPSLKDEKSKLRPVAHGFNFKGMFAPDERIPLEGKFLKALFFDREDHFVGVRLFDSAK